MKRAVIIILLSVLFGAKGTCKSFNMISYAGKQKIKVNGKLYVIDTVPVKIPTFYPTFDKLIFENEGKIGEVICNFKPDTIYAIIWACCGSMDLVPNSRYKGVSLEASSNDSIDDSFFEKIANHFVDKPFISIKTSSKTIDSIYAWHADAACLTESKLITDTLWRLGIPPKCFYWNNITYIQFFRVNRSSKIKRNEDVEAFVGKDHLEELAAIAFRLFDNQRFIIIYDEKTRKVKLKYEN